VLIAAGGASGDFVDIDVPGWAWVALLAFIVTLLLIDLLVIHRVPHEISTREAALESAVWIGIGLSFTLVMLWAFGTGAAGEYLSGYLIEESLSIDNVFVWALILTYFAVPRQYQHRVLFWGIFGALVLRATFIFAGIALIQRFELVLILFGAFLLFTAWRLVTSEDQMVDPEHSKVLKVVGASCRRRRSTTTPASSRRSTGGCWRRRSSPSSCWSRPPMWCSRSTPCPPSWPSATSSSSSSRPTPSPSSACAPCTSSSPGCTPASRTCSRAWR